MQVVWQLLLHGFSPFEIDENGNNALHLAAAGGHVEVVKSLMCQGFEVDCPNGFGNDALALATDATVVSLLRRAVKQTQCPVCHKCTLVVVWWFGGTHIVSPSLFPPPTPQPHPVGLSCHCCWCEPNQPCTCVRAGCEQTLAVK